MDYKIKINNRSKNEKKEIAECYKFFSTDVRVVARSFKQKFMCGSWKCKCLHLKMAATSHISIISTD